jgi:hypothetical protein
MKFEARYPFNVSFSVQLFFAFEDGANICLRNLGSLSVGYTMLHDKTGIFITTGVRTSRLTRPVFYLKTQSLRDWVLS